MVVSCPSVLWDITEYNRDFIRELQGVHALVETILVHISDPEIVRFSLTALGLLACQNSTYQPVH